MILGPRAILAELATRNPGPGAACGPEKVCSMPDAEASNRFIMPRGDELPAGSVILTGTPGGTAIKAPGLLRKLGLFVRGGFSGEGARRAFLADQLENALDLGYLQEGDMVEQAITGLGRQKWSVVPTPGLPAGDCAPTD